MSTIYAKMCAIQAEFPVVGKERGGAGISFKYRGIDDGLAALNPLLTKHEVFLQLCDLRTEFTVANATSTGKQQFRCLVNGTLNFVASDASYVGVSIAGEGIDSLDKALMKAQANALKYGIWYTFCVPTEEPKDSEAFPEDMPVAVIRHKPQEGASPDEDEEVDYEPKRK